MRKQPVKFHPNVQSRGVSYRNIVGTYGVKKLGIHSTVKDPKKQFLWYTGNVEGDEALNVNNSGEAFLYRQISDEWTPQLRRNPRLGPASARIVANVTKNANTFKNMKRKLKGKAGVTRAQRKRIEQRLYALYGPDSDASSNSNSNNNNSNNNNEEVAREWMTMRRSPKRSTAKASKAPSPRASKAPSPRASKAPSSRASKAPSPPRGSRATLPAAWLTPKAKGSKRM